MEISGARLKEVEMDMEPVFFLTKRHFAEKALLTVILLLTSLLVAGSSGLASAGEEKSDARTVIRGAGATFPMPVYLEWAKAYERKTSKKIVYRGIGSGGGIAHIKAKAVDFGASDEPLSGKDLEETGLIQFPMVMGGVVPVINVKGVRPGKLRLTPELLAAICLGDIKQWNDRRILAVNPNLPLPTQDVTVVHRADGSGTTWIFTSYLSKISTTWKEKVGSGKTVPWPTGIGGKGNPGVAALVGKTPGAIGYVEFAYVLQHNLTYVDLQNLAGKFVSPSPRAFQSAAENADWAGAKTYSVDLTDQPGQKTWPIVAPTYILLYKDQPDCQKAKIVLDFLDWCLNHGAGAAAKLDYVPLPKNVVKLVQALWKEKLVCGGEPLLGK
jgi:phosphate transport system substrate-binding protein